MTKNEAFEDIRLKIFREEHPPGAWLVERDLSAEYGLSRTPIRELLRDLAAVGLLEFQPAKGYRVRELRFEEVIEIFHAREAVEGMAARLACQKGGEEFFLALADLRRELAGANIGDDVDAGVALGQKLHDSIVATAENSVLSEVYEKLKCLSALTRNITRKFLRIEEDSRAAHMRIIDAVAKRTPDASERAMREHLEQTCRCLIDGYMISQLGRRG